VLDDGDRVAIIIAPMTVTPPRVDGSVAENPFLGLREMV
jgi:hypothetical protein